MKALRVWCEQFQKTGRVPRTERAKNQVQRLVLPRPQHRRKCLGGGRIVTAVEPLPASSPLWSMPGVIISPHMSGDFIGFPKALVSMFVDNFRRYRAGEPLVNVVDKVRGFLSSTDSRG